MAAVLGRASAPVREWVGEVTENRPIMGDSYLVTFTMPEGLAAHVKPGHFVNVLPSSPNVYDPLLRRPYSIYAVDPAANTMTLLIRPYGRGGQWIVDQQPGQTLNVLGILGNHYEIAPKSSHLLMVAGGVGAAPLRLLSEQAIAQGKSVTYLLGARYQEQLLEASELPFAVEYVIATEDGSAGHKGFVTDLVPNYLQWADQVFTCGPTPMMAALRNVVMQHRFGKGPQVQISVERTMACGVGACLGCVVETKKGMKASCVDGPVFDMEAVIW
ncbi:MAG: dihydroorotate dehydrogenase electron transfer subunit [Thermomicrobiales bacterium]|nr:dihydroorotate dehydrogenase electron transfer subunit [Thermomicrobiales bacterium]